MDLKKKIELECQKIIEDGELPKYVLLNEKDMGKLNKLARPWDVVYQDESFVLELLFKIDNTLKDGEVGVTVH